MKDTASKSRRAASSRVFLDVHPNVTIVHTGDASSPLFRQINDSSHGMDRAAVALVLKDGLKKQGYTVTVSEYGPDGKPLE
ncbi:MAG: hypothetical protein C0502_04995 [Opitutus sp.]|nr:hypothetical protein [Opitutus sp.]